MPSRRIPALPKTQNLTSTTFRQPPVDGSLSIVQMHEWHHDNSPNHRLFVYANDDGTNRNILWPEAVQAMRVGAKIVKERLSSRMNHTDTPIVAILAPSDTITYFTMIMAVIRVNCIAFPISPRNSGAAIAHLINKVNITHILLGHEQSMLDLAEETLKILGTEYPSTTPPSITPIPLFAELYLGTGVSVDADDLPITRTASDDIIFYMHSSGSTSFPKPLIWTNHRFIQLGISPYFGERDMTGQILSAHTMPMFHGMGVAQLGWTACAGVVLSVFEPKLPVPVPTPEALFKGAVTTNSDFIFCVPVIIEAWSRKPEYIKWLATRSGVLYGGGPLNKQAGDYMTSQGVSIFTLFGSTECGVLNLFIPRASDLDWDYFAFPKNIHAEMVPHGNNTYELVVVANPFEYPGVINTQINGIAAYASSDLMTPHPTKPGYWRPYGRADDQIIHSTGEKTNPGPLESLLNQDQHISAAVMFGRGQFQAGLLVDPKPEYRFDPSDKNKLADFRNKIWNSVQKANSFSPQHSRIFKEMIIVASPSKPFQYTAKTTARRQVVINDYEDEIKELYATVDESTQSSISPPDTWDILSTTDFIRTVVNKVLVNAIQDNDDLFEHGCDSLQATWIRNTIIRALRDSAQLDTRNSVDNFVYDHTSISRLSAYILNIVTGKNVSKSESEQPGRVDIMHAMVQKFTGGFPTHTSRTHPKSSGSAILVTGTTGALGCHILAQLVADPAVFRIFALNRVRRRDQTSLSDRQKLALLDRGLDPDVILNSDKVCLLEADLTLNEFGLSPNIFDELRSSVTHIIHNAWPVDFNLALPSFEPNIKGLRGLIDLALSSPQPQPPKFIYMSSVGIFQNLTPTTSLAERPVAAEVTTGTGYTESKWVAEQILIRCADQTPLKPVIVRVGQLCGGPNGSWNIKEWFPSIVHGSCMLGLLPADNKCVSWIPLHLAAAAILDFRHADLESWDITHLIHPKPTQWPELASILASELHLHLVPFEDWVAKLEAIQKIKSDEDEDDSILILRDVPALRLLSIYKAMASVSSTVGEAFGAPTLERVNSLKLSATLKHCQESLSDIDVGSWLKYWRQSRFL